jgi:hypothetical protein
MPIQLLVVAGIDPRRFRPDASASLGLVWGLERRGIAWTLALPGGGQPDPRRFDAVLSWWGSGSRRRHRFQAASAGRLWPAQERPSRVQFEREIEARCADLGIPVINPLSRRLGVRHSHCLRVWTARGVSCARFAALKGAADLDRVGLGFPLILRADGGAHALDDAFLVEDPMAARALMAQRARLQRAPFTLALEFRDTRWADGLYRKRRSFLVGDRLLPRQHMVAAGWQVKLKTALAGEPAIAEDRRFRAGGEEDPAPVRRAAQALGPEVLALDYTRREDGSYVFWEGNAVFGMAGLGDDERSRHYRAATGRSQADCREEHVELGTAIADLVRERVERGATASAPPSIR